MSYRVDIDTIFSDLITLLKANLITLNQKLTTPFSDIDFQILDGVPRPKPDGQYPAIFVYFGGKPSEEPASLGGRLRKEATYTIKIAGICKLFIQEGNFDNKDTRNLAANIDELIRNNPRFSSQILICNPSQTIIMDFVDTDKPYVNAFETSLECKLDVRKI